MNFNDYKRNLGGVKTNGQRHLVEAQDIIEHTWYDDPASTVAYLYSYEYDDEPDKNVGMHPECSKTKIPVDVKYSVVSYRSLAKDEVEDHKWREPMYLRLGDGRRFRLEFDCRECQMNVYSI